MKKLLLFILSFAYLFASFGASKSMHSCIAKLASSQFTTGETGACSSCDKQGKENNDRGCCSNEYRYFKMLVDQQSEDLSELRISEKPSVALPGKLLGPSTSLIAISSAQVSLLNASQPYRGKPIFLFVRNFRI